MATQRWNSRKLNSEPKNVTQIENTVAYKIQESKLIERMNDMTLTDIKTEFLNILSAKSTKIAKHTKVKYEMDCESKRSKTQLLYFLTNFLLKADGLGIN